MPKPEITNITKQIEKASQDKLVCFLYMTLFADLAGGKMIYRMMEKSQKESLACLTHLKFCSTQQICSVSLRTAMESSISKDANLIEIFDDLTKHYHRLLGGGEEQEKAKSASTPMSKETTHKSTSSNKGRLHAAFMSGKAHKEMERTMMAVIKSKTRLYQHIQQKQEIMSRAFARLLTFQTPESNQLKNELEKNNLFLRSGSDIDISTAQESYASLLNKDADQAKLNETVATQAALREQIVRESCEKACYALIMLASALIFTYEILHKINPQNIESEYPYNPHFGL